MSVWANEVIIYLSVGDVSGPLHGYTAATSDLSQEQVSLLFACGVLSII